MIRRLNPSLNRDGFGGVLPTAPWCWGDRLTAIAWLAGLLILIQGAFAYAVPIGISAAPALLAKPVVATEQSSSGLAGPSQGEARSEPHVSDDLTWDATAGEPTAVAAYGFLSSDLRGRQRAATAPGQYPALHLRPFREPQLDATISPNGTLSIGSGGDDLLLRRATRFRTGEGRLTTLPTDGLFSVLVQLEPGTGFLSGPFVSDPTFSGLYSSLETSVPTGVPETGIMRPAEFP